MNIDILEVLRKDMSSLLKVGGNYNGINMHTFHCLLEINFMKKKKN